MSKSPYEILGVTRLSSQKEIRKCYLDLCKIYHPDVTAGNNKASSTGIDIREITKAYEILTHKRPAESPRHFYPKRRQQQSNTTINTQVWTKRSYLIGFGIVSFVTFYLFSLGEKEKKRLLLPHEMRRFASKTTKPEGVTLPLPPWKSAGVSFREWRKS